MSKIVFFQGRRLITSYTMMLSPRVKTIWTAFPTATTEALISMLTMLNTNTRICSTPDFFFFSSRRRHTRCGRDWSSDVCSSDLDPAGIGEGEPVLVDARKETERDFIADGAHPPEDQRTVPHAANTLHCLPAYPLDVVLVVLPQPSEDGPVARLVGAQVVGPVLHPIPVVFGSL